jgi:hypothetical protein
MGAAVARVTLGHQGRLPRLQHLSGLVYFSGIFTPKRCGDMWGFGVHPIPSNPLKYPSPKILYHDGEFLI